MSLTIGFDGFIVSEDTINGTLKEGIDLQIGEVLKDGWDSAQVFSRIKLNVDCNLSKIKIRNNSEVQFFIEKDRKVELESAEFEKYYDFYADNKIEALQLFTTEVIEKINYFREKYNICFEMTIYKNEIYIRFWKNNFFELAIGKDILDYNMLYEYYKVIEMIGNIGIYFNDTIQKINLSNGE
ncbi:MAG: DUF3137 domain-containing protein [Candidatus Scatovivens sp.]